MKLKIIEKAYEYSYTWADNFKTGPWDITHGATRAQAKVNAFRHGEGENFKDIFNMRLRRRKEFDFVENTPHELVEQLSPEALNKMLHAIGNDSAERPYRNRYVIDYDDDFEHLITLGLATKATRLDMNVYFLTELGITVAQSTQMAIRHRLESKLAKETI